MCDQLVAEAATCTTRNKHKRQISMTSARSESAMPGFKQPWTHVLDVTATPADCVCQYRLKPNASQVTVEILSHAPTAH